MAFNPDPILVAAIRRHARTPEEAALALAVTGAETGGQINVSASAPGEDSEGPFQENIAGRGRGLSVAERRNPERSTQRFFAELRRTNRGGSLAEWGYNAQRPANRSGYIAKLNDLLPEARRILEQPPGSGPQHTTLPHTHGHAHGGDAGVGSVGAPASPSSPQQVQLPDITTLDPSATVAIMDWLAESDAQVRRNEAPSAAPLQALRFNITPGKTIGLPQPTTSTPAQQAGPPSRDPARGAPGTYEWAHDLANRFGVRVTSTFRSPAENRRVGGSPTSAHMTRGAAADFVGPPAAMARLQRYALANPQFFREAFYDPVGEMLDNGRRRRGSIGGHSDHVHLQVA